MKIGHIFTTTDFKKEANRNRIVKEQELDRLHLCGAVQTHSTNIAIVDAQSPIQTNDVDALITNTCGVGVYILTADCLPILIEDATNGVVAAVHAGWKGTAGRIVEKTIKKIIESYNSKPETMKAYIGPHIKSCCYEVGNEVTEAIGQKFIKSINENGKAMLSLTEANISQLTDMGILPENISVDDRCTCCNSLPSWRKNKTEDRIGSLIYITQ